MNKLDVQFLDEGFHRVLFNAMPMPAFVMDKDMDILDYNTAAAELVGKDRRLVIRRRGGEILHCVHFTQDSAGCGQAAACGDCVVRESVEAAARGRGTVRRCGELELVRKGRPTRVDLRVSCQPFTFGKDSLILLMLEGLDDPSGFKKTAHGRPVSRKAAS